MSDPKTITVTGTIYAACHEDGEVRIRIRLDHPVRVQIGAPATITIYEEPKTTLPPAIAER